MRDVLEAIGLLLWGLFLIVLSVVLSILPYVLALVITVWVLRAMGVL